MISCTGLTKDFGVFRAVSDASFHVPAGSICALLGPNGAGKSTLLKMLTRMLRPMAGEAHICGLPASDHALKRIYRNPSRKPRFVRCAHHCGTSGHSRRGLQDQGSRNPVTNRPAPACAAAGGGQAYFHPSMLLLNEEENNIGHGDAAERTCPRNNYRTTSPDEPQASRTIGTPA